VADGFVGGSGNDDDGEEKIPVPVKTVDKKTTGTVKRTAPEPQAPVRGSGGNRRGGPGGNEGGMCGLASPMVTERKHRWHLL
jgi:hypothetical protein